VSKLCNPLFHVSIIRGIATDSHEESQRARDALYIANEVINAYVVGSVDSMKECRKITSAFLQQKNAPGQHRVTAIGNCHIGKKMEGRGLIRIRA